MLLEFEPSSTRLDLLGIVEGTVVVFLRLQGPLSVVAHNRKVVGALSVVGATESQIFNNFLEFFQKFQQNLLVWISGNHLQFAEIPGKIRENFNEKQQI